MTSTPALTTPVSWVGDDISLLLERRIRLVAVAVPLGLLVSRTTNATLSVLILIYCVMNELARVVGRRELRAMFFGPWPGGARTVPPQR